MSTGICGLFVCGTCSWGWEDFCWIVVGQKKIRYILLWHLKQGQWHQFFRSSPPCRALTKMTQLYTSTHNLPQHTHTHIYTDRHTRRHRHTSCRQLCILFCNKRGQSILSHWKVWTKNESKVKLTDRWGSNRFKVNLCSLSPPFSYCLWKILPAPFIPPPPFSISSHTFPVEVILKTRFGPINLKLYSRSCGGLIESDIDTITTDKLD